MADESVQQENVAENVNTEAADSGKRDSYRRSSNQQNTRQQSSGGRSVSSRGGNDYRRTGRYQPRRKVCAFCVDKTKPINWKDVEGLRRFVTENGNMRARRKTGTCAKHQRRLAVAIKRARFLALLPYTTEHVRLTAKR